MSCSDSLLLRSSLGLPQLLPLRITESPQCSYETMLVLNRSRLSQAFGDSAMERLKQAVIDHEIVFRNQVRELHRLYWTQKNLMSELSRARKRGDMADQEASALVKNHHISFNLEIPADDFISSADDEHEESLIIKGQKPNVSCVGFDDFNVSTIHDFSSSNMHGSGAVLFDLNLPHEHDDEPCLDRVNIPFPCTDSSIVACGIMEPVPTEVCLDKISFAPKPDSANPGVKTACEKEGEWLFLYGKDSQAHGSQDSLPTVNNGKHNCDNENKMDINFVEYGKENVDSPSEHSDSKRQDSNITTCNSISLPEKIMRDSTDKLSDLDGSEYDTLSSHASAPSEPQEDALLKQFSVGYSSNGLSSKKGVAEPEALSIADDSVITQVNSPKHEISCNGSSKLGGHDLAIAVAAGVLMTISFGRSDNSKLAEVQCIRSNDQPQHSSDSFEFMTMHLSEVVNEEEKLITTDIPSFSERGKEGIQLRRGRRLRDFQKEILPGLFPLSRLEIREDMYSIGYKLRKNTATSVRGSCFVPVRRRRSRLSSGRRRS